MNSVYWSINLPIPRKIYPSANELRIGSHTHTHDHTNWDEKTPILANGVYKYANEAYGTAHTARCELSSFFLRIISACMEEKVCLWDGCGRRHGSEKRKTAPPEKNADLLVPFCWLVDVTAKTPGHNNSTLAQVFPHFDAALALCGWVAFSFCHLNLESGWITEREQL